MACFPIMGVATWKTTFSIAHKSLSWTSTNYQKQGYKISGWRGGSSGAPPNEIIDKIHGAGDGREGLSPREYYPFQSFIR